MSAPERFDLPGKMEKLLATMAGDYGNQNNLLMQQLLVNSTYHVIENTDYENWDGGQTGHTVQFEVPAAVFYQISGRLGDVGQELRGQLNNLSTCRGEFISGVLFELQDDDLIDWRENSGAVIHKTQLASGTTDDLDRIWGTGYLRLFLSHKSEYKKETAELKEALLYYGVSAFVAHEDVKPTKKWEAEIEKALSSMDAMVALLTPRFGDSEWTDQEVGIAVARGVPVVPVRLGLDPYGFVRRYQAVAGHGKTAQALANEIFELLFSEFPTIKDSVSGGLVTRFEQSRSYAHANKLMLYIDRLDRLPAPLIERLERAPKANRQVEFATAVQLRLPDLLARLRGPE